MDNTSPSARMVTRKLDSLPPTPPNGPQQYFVYYSEPEPCYVANGRVVDSDTFAMAVRRAGMMATVIRVEYPPEVMSE